MKTAERENPWRSERAGAVFEIVDLQSRMDTIKDSRDILWLKKVVAWADNQLSVRMAAERRLRVISRVNGLRGEG